MNKKICVWVWVGGCVGDLLLRVPQKDAHHSGRKSPKGQGEWQRQIGSQGSKGLEEENSMVHIVTRVLVTGANPVALEGPVFSCVDKGEKEKGRGRKGRPNSDSHLPPHAPDFQMYIGKHGNSFWTPIVPGGTMDEPSVEKRIKKGQSGTLFLEKKLRWWGSYQQLREQSLIIKVSCSSSEREGTASPASATPIIFLACVLSPSRYTTFPGTVE